MRFTALFVCTLLAMLPPAFRGLPRAYGAAPDTGHSRKSGVPQDLREATLARATLELLEKEHLLHKRVDDELSRVAFATYLDRLDSGKMFLLKADRDALGKYADKIDDQLRAGSLELGHEGQRILIKRVSMVEAWVAALLASPLDHTNKEDVELDPKKVTPAANEAELKDRWRRRLELEVLERVAQMQARLAPSKTVKTPAVASAPGRPKEKSNGDDDEKAGALRLAEIPKTPQGRETKARADLAKSYAARFVRLAHPAPVDAAADLVNAVAASVDPHTNYLPPADRANFDIQMRGSLEGIGAVLREKDDYIEIVELVPGGAAWRQGQLDPGDLILAIASGTQDAVDAVNMRIDEVVNMIRGPKGTVVTLRVRKATGLEETVAITRDVVVVEEAYAKAALITKKGQPAYGYIHLPSFYGGEGSARDSASDVRHLLRELNAKKVAGVILDVRGNGGGLLGSAIEMSGAFIEKGPIVQVRDSKGRRQVLTDDDAGADFTGPVIILVDRFSASASEILAGSLQDYRRAVIVGTSATHGKGTVQTLIDLDRATGGQLGLGVFKLTIQQFFRVNGSSTQSRGVSPDVTLPDPAGYIESGERELEHALPWSQITPAEHDDWKSSWNAAALSAASVARVSKDPVFAKVTKLTQLMKAREADTRVPLAEADFMKQREQQRAEIAAASPKLDESPKRFSVMPIDQRAPVAAAANGKKDSRVAKWSDNLARDPWVDESLNILTDMKK
ncbi:MAG: carboxy terminal-processing peptidase [Deltaproteobacteria bacterium]|nr:carboxy terminal-processing peptidase [Deltaproteobacteria bacterium]